MVTVKLSAKGELKGVKIDDSLVKPEEKEILEDLLVAAHADARRKAEDGDAGQDEGPDRRPVAAARAEVVLACRRPHPRHARPCAGHPRLASGDKAVAWPGQARP